MMSSMIRQVLALHVADHVHHFGHVHIGAALVHDGQRCAHLLRKEARPLHAARIRRNHRQVGQRQLAEVAHQHRAGVKMIDGNIEKALNLRRVQVNKQSAIGPGRGHQIGHQPGADGHARTVLAILAGIAVIGHHHRDPARRGPLERIDHHQQFDQMLIHRIAGRLHHKNIDAAHIFQQLEVDLAVGEALHLGLAHRNSDVAANLLGQRPDWPCR